MVFIAPHSQAAHCPSGPCICGGLFVWPAIQQKGSGLRWGYSIAAVIDSGWSGAVLWGLGWPMGKVLAVGSSLSPGRSVSADGMACMWHQKIFSVQKVGPDCGGSVEKKPMAGTTFFFACYPERKKHSQFLL